MDPAESSNEDRLKGLFIEMRHLEINNGGSEGQINYMEPQGLLVKTVLWKIIATARVSLCLRRSP